MRSTPSRYEIFLHVARTQNFSQSAKVLHYTQAGISHAIAEMEKQFGIQLFIRLKNGVCITEHGKRLIPIINQIVSKERDLQMELSKINHAPEGLLRIGAFSSVMSTWIPKIINLFQYKYPKVRLEILDGPYNQISSWLNQGKIDCGFLTLSQISNDMIFYHLLNDPLLVIAKKDHPILQKEFVDVKELSQYPLIIENEQNDNDTQIIISHMSINPKIAYRLADDVSILSFAYAGLGIAIIPKLVLQAAHSPMVYRSFNPIIYRNIGLAVKPSFQNEIFKLFLQQVQLIIKTDHTSDISPCLLAT